MELRDFFQSAMDYFKEKGMKIEINPQFAHGFNANLYAHFEKSGLLAYEDHFFLHDFSKPDWMNRDVMIGQHEHARRMVNSHFRMPRAFRLKVPNIITVCVSPLPFTHGMVDYINRHRPSRVGGESHQIFLIELANGGIHSMGINQVYIPGTMGLLRMQFKEIDPINRGHYIIHEMCHKIYAPV